MYAGTASIDAQVMVMIAKMMVMMMMVMMITMTMMMVMMLREVVKTLMMMITRTKVLYVGTIDTRVIFCLSASAKYALEKSQHVIIIFL